MFLKSYGALSSLSSHATMIPIIKDLLYSITTKIFFGKMKIKFQLIENHIDMPKVKSYSHFWQLYNWSMSLLIYLHIYLFDAIVGILFISFNSEYLLAIHNKFVFWQLHY